MCGTSHLEIEYLVSKKPRLFSQLFILGTCWYAALNVAMEGNIHRVYHHEPQEWVGVACIMASDRTLHNVCMIERVMSAAWLCGYKTTSRICPVALRLRFCVREGGEVTEPQMLRFPFTPEFHVHYKSVPSKVNVKTLQINPESDRSSVSCLWYHFPSKWYGWGSDNCHPDLASLHHSPKTH